ncbi:hypothetical protein J7T55_008770 [Diaporthe amygdali]|uniref:uncharacterized protein n=1 Tax=Phomopsis amygdali TaxID=1214568 RepID=UPI0022FED40A|nr:uncharacterized protein J7T55_008770 [Diaporthe amygdali]KAJ0121604.1 hypothetical protein J7T55_008770 [Diaporthe amygdali]
MAVPTKPGDSTSGEEDTAFLEQSFLAYTVPFKTTINIEEEIKAAIEKGQPLEDFENRPWLFFDETVEVFLILRTHGLTDELLKSYLKRLVVTLQAQIVNSPATERTEIAPASEVVYNEDIEDVENPLTVVDSAQAGQEDDGMAPGTKYVVWKASAFLTRPRMRLYGPSVVFSATASLKPGPEQLGEQQDGYLESGVPAGLNLLGSFAGDPLLGGVKPHLSAVRVSRVAPVTQSKDSFPILKGQPRISQQIYPAAHTRVRFARPNTIPPSPAIIALLEIDFTPYFDCEVAVDKVDLSMREGQVEDLNNISGLSLPLNCVAHDHITLMYRLAPQESDVPSRSPTRELLISIECSALVQAGVCTPKLRMAWSTILDFTLPVNPGFGSGVNKPFQRSHKPAQLSISDGTSFVSPSVSRPDSLPGLEALAERSIETSIPEFGITMTFTAPDGPIYPGDEFVWNVFVVNRNSTSLNPSKPPSEAIPAARKLALLAIPRRRRNDMRVIRPPSTAGRDHLLARRKSAIAAAIGEGPEAEIADAVLDENIVHAMQRSSLVDSTEVVCLSADVRVGPLAPNACHVVELRFLALKEGIVGVECIRVVDLGNQEHVDIRDLPVMVVEKRQD